MCIRDRDKIKEIIGKGGAVIKGIQQDSGASVDIDDNGVVTIFGQNQSQMQKALEIIENGGNAFDAAICAAAVLAVVEPHSTGIGGDCFCLFYSSSEKKVKALNGSGCASENIDFSSIKLTEQNNLDPYTANAVTIPGAVAAWEKILKDYGNLSLKETLKPAIEIAENGYVVADVIADMWDREKKKLEIENNF